MSRILLVVFLLLGSLLNLTVEAATALTKEEIVNGAVGPFENFCDGYGNAGASGLGYISVLKLETGKVRKDMDELLEGIVSYDRAECRGTYIGQINMITASSFTGLNGAVWGYHLAKDESIASGSLKPLFLKKRSDAVEIPVYPIDPLLNAGRRLFGTENKRRFPLLPGAHVACAVKSVTANGPTFVWCALALAIAEDESKDADLFIEDVGDSIPGRTDEERKAYLDRLMENIALSIIRCGDDSNVKYKQIYIGYKMEWIPQGYVGCALTCAPYIVLARKAVPNKDPASKLLKMTISEWEKAIGF